MAAVSNSSAHYSSRLYIYSQYSHLYYRLVYTQMSVSRLAIYSIPISIVHSHIIILEATCGEQLIHERCAVSERIRDANKRCGSGCQWDQRQEAEELLWQMSFKSTKICIRKRWDGSELEFLNMTPLDAIKSLMADVCFMAHRLVASCLSWSYEVLMTLRWHFLTS